MSKELRAVLVDDDGTRVAAFKDVWKEILGRIFPYVDVRTVGDIERADEILAHRPHVVLVDNVFPDKSTKREMPNRGVDFIVTHRDQYPDTLFVLYTGNTFQVDVLGNKFPNPDIIVTKTSLKNAAYQSYVSERIAQQIKRLPVPEVVFVEPKDAMEVDDLREELHSIIEQCLMIVQNRAGEDYVQQVNLERLGGGFSGSYVYLARIYGPSRYSNLPFVLKLTKGTDVSVEVARYNTFARLQMPHDMRVDLLGGGRTGKCSGALYAFAFGKTGGITSAAEQLRAGNFTVLQLIKDRMFLSSDIGWYKDVRLDVGVEEFYSNSDEYDPSKDSRRLDTIRANVDEIFGVYASVDEDHYQIGSYHCQHIRRYLQRFHDKKMPRTISHGDFNANNIILSTGTPSISTIDFEYTGYDCFYKDFVSLESSVRTAWSGKIFDSAADCWNLHAIEVALLSGTDARTASVPVPEATPYFEAISDIRDAANKSIEKAGQRFDMTLYILALGFHMLKLNGLGVWDRSTKIKLLACLLACGSKLDLM